VPTSGTLAFYVSVFDLAGRVRKTLVLRYLDTPAIYVALID